MKKLIKSCKESYIFLFIISILISMEAYLLITVFSSGAAWSSIFFDHAKDSFMDFFNSLRDASLGGGAYTERHVIYPPMANLIFWLLSFVTPAAYNGTSFDERYTWNEYQINTVIITLFVILSIVLFALLVYKSVKLPHTHRLLLTLVAVFSVPFLNMLERGNIMTLAFIALTVYAVTYNSRAAWIRELGIICLAFSFSLKLYPIIFAWILIGDKRYKEFARCALYSLAFLIIPSFAFGGPACLLTIFKNITSFSSGTGNVLSVISKYTHIPYNAVSGVSYVWFFLTCVNFLAAPFIYKERWKVWAAGCIAFISYPALCSTYAWTLFIIPVIYLCNEGFANNWVKGARRKGYLICMLIPFLFFGIPMPLWAPVTANAVIIYFVVVIIAAFAIYDTVRTVADLASPRQAIIK